MNSAEIRETVAEDIYAAAKAIADKAWETLLATVEGATTRPVEGIGDESNEEWQAYLRPALIAQFCWFIRSNAMKTQEEWEGLFNDRLGTLRLAEDAAQVATEAAVAEPSEFDHGLGEIDATERVFEEDGA